jgi:quinol monooxygenase YgiN
MQVKENVMAIGVIATLKVREGKNTEFETVFTQLASTVREKELGNNYYDLHQSRKDSQVYIVMEQYKDQAALEAHGQTDYFKSAGAKMGGCMAGAPVIEYLDSID